MGVVTDPIVVVSGCPRSGTSMMMGMLVAGGLEPHCEPQNYGSSFESDDVLRLPAEHAWLADCAGKAVKILDPQRFIPPPTYAYLAIFMTRHVAEQAKSTARFSRIFGLRVRAADLPTLRASLRLDTAAGLRTMRGLDPWTLVVRFEDVLADPAAGARAVADHVVGLDAGAMAAAVHARGPQALREPMELGMVGR